MIKPIYKVIKIKDMDGNVIYNQSSSTHLQDTCLLSEQHFISFSWTNLDLLWRSYSILSDVFYVCGKDGHRTLSFLGELKSVSKEKKNQPIPFFIDIDYHIDHDFSISDLINEPIQKAIKYCKENEIILNFNQ